MRKLIPIDFTPKGSKLIFVRQTSKQGVWENGNREYAKAIYRCECGVEKEMLIGNVKSGKVVSCGCFQKEEQSKRAKKHGLTKHPLFRVWSDIKSRCTNEKRDSWQYYGAKGVSICDEWKNSPEKFIKWALDNGWRKGMQIDKDIIPKKLSIPAILYSPDMCTIVTVSDNCHNRSTNHPITFNGVTKNLTQWESDLGFRKDVIYNRLKRGWSEERALSTPLLRKYKNKVNGNI